MRRLLLLLLLLEANCRGLVSSNRQHIAGKKSENLNRTTNRPLNPDPSVGVVRPHLVPGKSALAGVWKVLLLLLRTGPRRSCVVTGVARCPPVCCRGCAFFTAVFGMRQQQRALYVFGCG